MKLPMLPHDHANHTIYCVCLFLLGAFIAKTAGFGLQAQMLAGAGLAGAFSLIKELIIDKVMKKGAASWNDMAANVFGMALGAAGLGMHAL